MRYMPSQLGHVIGTVMCLHLYEFVCRKSCDTAADTVAQCRRKTAMFWATVDDDDDDDDISYTCWSYSSDRYRLPCQEQRDPLSNPNHMTR
jgi:hypothetical protein